MTMIASQQDGCWRSKVPMHRRLQADRTLHWWAYRREAWTMGEWRQRHLQEPAEVEGLSVQRQLD